MKLDYETPQIEDHLAQRLERRSYLSIQSSSIAVVLLGIALFWFKLLDSGYWADTSKIIGSVAGVGSVVLIPTSIYQGFIATCSTDRAVRRRGITGMVVGGMLVGGLVLLFA